MLAKPFFKLSLKRHFMAEEGGSESEEGRWKTKLRCNVELKAAMHVELIVIGVLGSF